MTNPSKPPEKEKVEMDVTIELDMTDEEWAEMEVLYEEMDDEEDEVVISDPLKLSDVSFRLPGGIRIKQLSKDLKEVLFANLDIPSNVSVGTWQSVSEFLAANDTFPQPMQTISTHDPWKPYENMHVQVLVNALHKSERIDLLWKFKEMVDENDYLEPVNEPAPTTSAPPATTVAIPATIDERIKKIDARNMILVQHYEISKKDKINFRWFFDNFKEHLKQPQANGMKAVDVADLEKEDGGNQIQMLEHVYPQFKHIIVCFSDSYIRTVRGNKTKFSFRKTIHDKTIMEFVNNGSRNKRCRCLIMPETTEPLETLWATVTYRFSFPEGYDNLLERLFGTKVPVKDMSATGVHDEVFRGESSRNMYTQ